MSPPIGVLLLFAGLLGRSVSQVIVEITTNFYFDQNFTIQTDDVKARCLETVRVERRVNGSMVLDMDTNLCPTPISYNISPVDDESMMDNSTSSEKIGKQIYGFMREKEDIECVVNGSSVEKITKNVTYILKSKLALGEEKECQKGDGQFSVVQLCTTVAVSMISVCIVVWFVVRHVEKEKRGFVRSIEAKYKMQGPKKAGEKESGGRRDQTGSQVPSGEKLDSAERPSAENPRP